MRICYRSALQLSRSIARLGSRQPSPTFVGTLADRAGFILYSSVAVMPLTASQRGTAGFQPFTSWPPHPLASKLQFSCAFPTRKQQWRGNRRFSRSCCRTGAAGGAVAPAAPSSWAAGSSNAAQHSSTHLVELDLKDFALVAEQRVELQPGLTVITGASARGRSAGSCSIPRCFRF
jgi:hypothetical protein